MVDITISCLLSVRTIGKYRCDQQPSLAFFQADRAILVVYLFFLASTTSLIENNFEGKFVQLFISF